MRARVVTRSRVATVAAATLSSLVLAVAVALAAAPAASAASPPAVAGATVLSSTSVKVVFSRPVAAPSATTLSNYLVLPTLAVSAVSLADSGYGVVLTTSPQLNGETYTVTAENIVGVDGTHMAGASGGSFIGTAQGPVSTTSGHDDFNRPSGLITTDAPIPGPWLSTTISTLNLLYLTANPAFNGAGALNALVADIDPSRDNALVRYSLASGNEYWVSAYVFIPSGQGWGSQQEIGLMRLMQSLEGSQARVSAIDQSSSTRYGLNVNWKSTGNAYLTSPPVIATAVPFDTWQWIELHVKNATSTSQGEIQVWLNGTLVYSQDTIYVYPAKMVYSQFGIMHLVTKGPAARTITDEVRFGPTFQLPSSRLDTTAPTVQLTSPTAGTALGSSVSLAATANDNIQVQRVDFTVDGKVVNSDDLAPYQTSYSTSGLTAGTHAFGAVSYDTWGNASAASAVTATVGTSPGSPPVVTLTSPADGGTWQAGSSQALGWNLSAALSNGSFKVYARNTSSGTQNLLTPSAIATAAGQTTYGAQYTVRLAAGSYAVFVNTYDSGGKLIAQSTASTVTVVPVTLTAPVGGDAWQTGSTQTAAWSLVSPLSGGTFKIWAKNPSGTLSLLGQAPVIGGQTTYGSSFAVKLAGGTYTVYVSYYDSSGKLVVASTMATITVYPIALTAPAKGASWPSGSSQTLSWTLGLPLSSGSFKAWAQNSSGNSTLLTGTSVPVVSGQTDYSCRYTVKLASGAYNVWVSYYNSSGSLVVKSTTSTVSVP